MEGQQPVSTAARAPLIANPPSIPWWTQRSKRQTRWVHVDMPRRRPRSVKKSGPLQAQAVKSTGGAAQATSSTSSGKPGSNAPANKTKRRRKKNRMLVLDKWVSDSVKQSEAPNGHIVLDSWVNESVMQSTDNGSESGEAASDDGCGQEDHVTNNPVVVDQGSQPYTTRQAQANNQGLTSNELIKIFRKKKGCGRRNKGGKKNISGQQQVANQRPKRLISNDNVTAPERSETIVKLEVPIKLDPSSPPPSTRPPLLSHPPLLSTWPPVSSITPRTSSADVLKHLPPFSGLTSAFDSSLSDPVRVPSNVPPLERPMHARSYPSNPHSGLSDRPLPLLDNGDLTDRVYPPNDAITHSRPLKRNFPDELDDLRGMSRYQDHPQPGYQAGSIPTTSLNPDLKMLSPVGMNDRPFSRPSSMPMASVPPLLAHSPPRPSRQLKITSFLSPPKKRFDNRLEPEFSSSLTHSASHVSLSTRLSSERPGYGTVRPSLAPPYYPSSEPRGSSSVPLSRLNNQDSVFERLDSRNKFSQSRLQFGADPQRNPVVANPFLDTAHDDPFSRLGPSVTGQNALTMSLIGDSYASRSGVRSPLESDQRRPPHLHSDDLHMPVDSRFSRSGSNVLVKIEPGVKYELDEDSPASSCLYETRHGGYDVAKLLKRYAPREYQATDVAPQPQPRTSYAIVKQEREVKNISSIDSQHLCNSSSGERFVDIQDATRHVQIPGSSQAVVNLSERTVSEANIDNSSEQYIEYGSDDDIDYVRYVESTPIHIPLSRKGLKVIAIDCEMVGCVIKIPPEQLLASNLKGVTKGGVQMNKGGLGGVLLKTRMKPRAQTKKKKQKNTEISIAARCSIIGYDGSVLYDKYINPTIGTDYKIIHFRTPWSGIKRSHMTGATPFKDARQEILNILQGCIVVGHNIRSDLSSLEIHNLPASQIRDTSIHPTLKKRAGMPANKQPGALKVMSLALLGRTIQSKSRVGHCSVEDATATMDLYKLVELEWEN